MVIENLCPVCGYEMEVPPKDYNICPSCGTEFGLHDVNSTVAELRATWLQSGPKWWSVSDTQPENWNPFAQIAAINCSSAVVPTEPSFVLAASSNIYDPFVNVSLAQGFGEQVVNWAVNWASEQTEDTQLAKVA
jgi:hypothetical protein